jgi:hypothetical protein
MGDSVSSEAAQGVDAGTLAMEPPVHPLRGPGRPYVLDAALVKSTTARKA